MNKNEQHYAALEKKRQILEAKKQGINRQNEFVRQKVGEVRVGVHDKMREYKNQITSFENEAQQLERIEAELLAKLQET